MPEPLASPDDLAARLGVAFSDDETDRAEALLADASALVRNYTRQHVTRVVDDTATLEATREAWLYLPQRPVVSVSAVSIGGAPLAVGQWAVQGDALYRFLGWGRYRGSFGLWNQPDTIAVTYTHGYDTVPDDIVRVVCKLAQASWLNREGYRSASVGGVSVTLDTATVGVGSLDADDRLVLDRYRRARRSIQFSAGVV